LLDWFLPKQSRTDAVALRSGRFVVGLAWIAVVVEPFFALRHFYWNHNAMAGWITVGVAILAASLPLLIRFARLPTRVGIHIICAIVLIAGTGVCFSRHAFLTAPVMGGVFLPLSGVIVASRRPVIVWWAIASSVLATIGLLAHFECFGLRSAGAGECPQLIFFVACAAVMGLAYDHTRRELERERELIQARLAKTQRVESLGFLAAGIAHDFNNLLAVIRSSASNLIADLPPHHPAATDAVSIEEAVERGAAITSRLLTFSRQEQPAIHAFDVKKTVREGMGLFSRAVSGANQATSSTKDIELTVDLGAEGEVLALGDPREIEQALLNLVVNARDAILSSPSSKGGKIRIAIQRSEQPTNGVVISVDDNGPGIAADVLPHLFEPFFTTKERGAGTGLGLSTAYGAIKAMDGDLRVWSVLGEGARFEIQLLASERSVVLPVSPQEEIVKAEPAPVVAPVSSPVFRARGSSPASVRVLLVDDQELVLRSTRRLLVSAGFDVITATSGDGALETLDSLGPDGRVHVLLTDIVMPKMSGVELAAQIRKRGGALPIVYCSGHFDDPAVREQIDEGLATFLSKPFSRELLLSTVNEALALKA